MFEYIKKLLKDMFMCVLNVLNCITGSVPAQQLDDTSCTFDPADTCFLDISVANWIYYFSNDVWNHTIYYSLYPHSIFLKR